MSFATNSSAFGLKPNTLPATGASLFGTPSTSTSTGAFGAAPAASTSAFGAAKPAGSLFGAPATNQPQNSNSLFGSNASQNTQPTNSLFGAPANNQAQNQNLLLGGNNQQQQGGGLFGKPAQSQQQQPQTSLFGQPQQQQQTTSLFGQPAAQQQQQQQQPQQQQNTFGGGTSLFGNTSTSGGIFGQQQQQQPQQQQTSLFGSTSTQPTTGFGSTGGIFGQKPAQPAQQPTLGLSTAQAAGSPIFTRSTKFNDLPDQVKRRFEEIETHIQGRIQISKDLQQRKLGQEATKGQELVKTVHKDLVNTTTTIKNDVHFTRDLKAKMDQSVQDTIAATRIVDGFKNPQANGHYLKDHAAFPLEYFTRVTGQMQEKLAWYRTTIEQIERKLASLANQTQYTPQGIVSTLQAQHSTFLALASKTASLDAELQKIKVLYTQLWRARTGSVRDPFNELDMDSSIGAGGDLGMGGLAVR